MHKSIFYQRVLLIPYSRIPWTTNSTYMKQMFKEARWEVRDQWQSLDSSLGAHCGALSPDWASALRADFLLNRKRTKPSALKPCVWTMGYLKHLLTSEMGKVSRRYLYDHMAHWCLCVVTGFLTVVRVHYEGSAILPESWIALSCKSLGHWTQGGGEAAGSSRRVFWEAWVMVKMH